MADAPTLVRWLARARVPLGFVFGAAVLWLAAPTPRTVAAGGAIAALGEAMRIWAAGHLNKSREVTASGPYRWFAHPLYVGSSVMGAGLAVACWNPIVAALIAIYLGATLTAAIRSEEAFLRGKFGDRYDRYRRGRGEDADAAEAARRRFSIGQALANREYRALIGLALVILLLAWMATYNGAFWQTAGTHIVRPGG